MVLGQGGAEVVEPLGHARAVRVVQRTEIAHPQPGQRLDPLLERKPVVDWPGWRAAGGHPIEESPDLLLHPIRHEMHMQVSDPGNAQFSQPAADLRITTWPRPMPHSAAHLFLNRPPPGPLAPHRTLPGACNL